MHAAAFDYVRRHGTNRAISVIEIGSRDINGTARPFFPLAYWIGLDLHPGPCVDVVCDAEQYVPELSADLVVCCEVLEHAANWKQLIQAAARWLKKDGRIIITCAGPGRAEHSAIDGEHRLIDGEHYRNISADELAEELHYAGFVGIDADSLGEDTRAIAYMGAYVTAGSVDK